MKSIISVTNDQLIIANQRPYVMEVAYTFFTYTSYTSKLFEDKKKGRLPTNDYISFKCLKNVMQEQIKYRISYLFRSNFVLKILKGGTVCKTDFLNIIRYSLCYNLYHLLLHNFCPFFRKKGPVVFF